MDVTFIGSGDAFGSGGRFNTCFLAAGAKTRFLIDCGASSPVALKHAGFDLNDIDGVALTHLHGDHFGGLPFLLLDAQLMSKRTKPFFIWGPAGFPQRLQALREALFPGSSTIALKFEIETVELAAGQRHQGEGLAVTPFPAMHSAGDSPCFSLRFECDGKVVTYSGDTAWSGNLADAARGADLFICECSSYERPVKGHLAYLPLQQELPGIGARRVILTHMNPDMLARLAEVEIETARDGLTVTV